MTAGVVHSFADQLKWSQGLSDEGSWIAFYKRLWPDMVNAVRIDENGVAQKSGVDRLVLLPNGRTLTIDEKKRATTYTDLLVEEWSVWKGENHRDNHIGWTLDPDKRCDFVAYAIPLAGRCYLLPFELTRQTALVNLPEWKRLCGGKPKVAENRSYKTINWPVEWARFKTDLEAQMNRRFDADCPIELPTPIVAGNQIAFTWGEK